MRPNQDEPELQVQQNPETNSAISVESDNCDHNDNFQCIESDNLHVDGKNLVDDSVDEYESLSVNETCISDSNFLFTCVYIGNRKISALLDSGSSINLISMYLFDRIPAKF